MKDEENRVMLKLTYNNFIKARDYIFAHTDEINHAWFRYHFEDGDVNAFMDALGKYQCENGGFGGLYYEFDYQGPCLKSTEVAIRYIFGLKEKPSAEHPVIKKAMKYILGNYHPEIGNWGEVAVPEVNDGAHCYWVRYRGEGIIPIESEDERIKQYVANEKVCFAAFVEAYSELVPEELYSDIMKYPIQNILRYWDENSPDYDKEIFADGTPYNFEYYQQFVACIKDSKLADKLTSILCQNPTAFMVLDYSKSDNSYVHLPCDSVKTPDSVIYPVVKRLIDESLEYRIKQQSEDGRWPLGWSFGEGEGLQKLQIIYEAHCSLGMLVKLKGFGRIECGKDASIRLQGRLKMGYIMDLRKNIGHQPIIMTSACVLVLNDRKQVLLQRRTDNGLWGYPGGAMELGESFEECARREVLEETGLECIELTYFTNMSGEKMHYIYPNGDEVYIAEVVFLCNNYKGELKVQEAEAVEQRFFDLQSLPDNISPMNAEVLQMLIEKVIE